VTTLDEGFIKRAKKITSFNLTSSDFSSTKYKLEIQHLYKNHMFDKFDPSMALDELEPNLYNDLVRVLRSEDKIQYEKLHNLPLKGIGPGEAALYLLTKNGYLGGGSSAGVDLIVGEKKYEVKAVKWKSKVKKDYVSDFKLGGGIAGMAQLEAEVQSSFYEYGYTKLSGTPEIKGSLFEKFANEHPDVYTGFETRYRELSKSYFSEHDVVFIQTESNQPDFGEILSIKKVVGSDIKMERYTSRTIKPLVRIR
jgi:hypothetical protein